jgi:hypothetical protein
MMDMIFDRLVLRVEKAKIVKELLESNLRRESVEEYNMRMKAICVSAFIGEPHLVHSVPEYSLQIELYFRSLSLFA